MSQRTVNVDQARELAREGGILALDPAATTGWATWDGKKTRYGVWHLTLPSEPTERRLTALRKHILDEASFIKIGLVAFEGASFGSKNRNTRAMHNELRGIIKLTAQEIGAEAAEFNPRSLKKFATGSGKASKAQMVRAARLLLSVDITDDNIADALFILKMAKQYGTSPLETSKLARRTIKRKRKKEPRLF